MAKEQFLGRHVGPRPEDVEEMLKVIGVKSVDELIEQTVPASIRLQELLDLPAPLTEDEFLARIRAVAAKNKLYSFVYRTRILRYHFSGCYYPEYIGKSGLVYFLYSLSGRSIPGTSGSFAELSDHDYRTDSYGDHQLFSAG